MLCPGGRPRRSRHWGRTCRPGRDQREEENKAIEKENQRAKNAAEASKLEEAKAPELCTQSIATLVSEGVVKKFERLRMNDTKQLDNIDEPVLIYAMTAFLTMTRLSS